MGGFAGDGTGLPTDLPATTQLPCRRNLSLRLLARLQICLFDFVVGLLNYCVDGKEHLSRLAFDVYDRHTTGTITEADLEGMLIDVWGANW